MALRPIRADTERADLADDEADPPLGPCPPPLPGGVVTTSKIDSKSSAEQSEWTPSPSSSYEQTCAAAPARTTE